MINTIEHPELIMPAQDVEQSRSHFSASLDTTAAQLAVIWGPCAPDTPHVEALHKEGEDISMVSRTISKLRIVHGLPVRKPRSNPQKSWPGMESTDPDGALSLIERSSRDFAHTAMEIVNEGNILAYAHLLTLAWTGARNKDIGLKLRLASEHQTLPLPDKNGLDGEIEPTLEEIERLKQERDPDGAAIVLLYRGGENAKTPDAWEKQYLRALQLTDGKMIVDVAHGSEMAHDPNRNFHKSVLGQLACLDHVIELAEDGFVPAGIKVESSNTPSPIDPVISMQAAYEAIMRLRLAV